MVFRMLSMILPPALGNWGHVMPLSHVAAHADLSHGVTPTARALITADEVMIDGPQDSMRLRCACALLDTCGQYFSKGTSKRRAPPFSLQICATRRGPATCTRLMLRACCFRSIAAASSSVACPLNPPSRACSRGPSFPSPQPPTLFRRTEQRNSAPPPVTAREVESPTSRSPGACPFPPPPLALARSRCLPRVPLPLPLLQGAECRR